jgi:hypothetical protein
LKMQFITKNTLIFPKPIEKLCWDRTWNKRIKSEDNLRYLQ